MKRIEWLTSEGHGEWDAFVARHPLGLVYHLSCWQKSLESAFRHIRGRFLVLRDDQGGIQAGLPVYTVASWLLGNRTVSVPYATLCDPLVSSPEELGLLWPEIERSAKQHGSKAIEIRGKGSCASCQHPQLAVKEKFLHHYLPLHESTDVLFRNLDNTTIRQRIRKAGRSGIVVEQREQLQDLQSLHALLVATRRKHALPPMPFVFFEEIQRSLGGEHAAIYLALHEGTPVGGMLVLKFKDMWISEYSGVADSAVSGVGPFLNWDVIQRAKASGASCFSFGRTSLDNTGLLDHKRRWGTREEELIIYTNRPKPPPAHGDSLPRNGERSFSRRAAQLFTRYAPASVQQMFGDFCYRHLG